MTGLDPPPGAGDHPRVHEGYFPVSGAQLYFREVGNGAPLVILHGGPDFNHNYLLPELDRLRAFCPCRAP